ncbi:hypothetical protein DSO57_1038510 [Entomophthora muscae]|uniref:Uncharacterized protein n=1 Tax=Entomophthora muscae TaxID=34485 RepID=A0ACC2RDD3_9FUNG|nr:hypothetical protein DSO57_1038510 [Entomophthora muscae]
MGYTVPEESSTEPPKRKTKQNNGASKRKFSKKILSTNPFIPEKTQEKNTLPSNTQDLASEISLVKPKKQDSNYHSGIPDVRESTGFKKIEKTSPMNSIPKALNSKGLNGFDVSLNDNDMEYLAIKAAEDELKKIKAQNDELVQSLATAKSKLRVYENDYKFRLEEKHLSKEDISSFCNELLGLPHLQLSDKLESILRNSESFPEDVFLIQDEIKESLYSLIQSETEKKKCLEETLSSIPTKRRVELTEKVLRDLEAEEDILIQEISTLEKRYAISTIIQSSTSALPSNASNDVRNSHSDISPMKKPWTPQNKEPILKIQDDVLDESLANSIPDASLYGDEVSALDNDSLNISLAIPDEASVLDDRAVSILDFPEDAAGAFIFDHVSVTSPIPNAPEKGSRHIFRCC